MKIKSKKTKLQMHSEFYLGTLTMLLVIVILLLVTPTACNCRGYGGTAIIDPSVAATLAPTSGPVGSTVTIHGSGFGSDNTIEMNGLVGASMKDVASADGKTLTFVVPQTIGPNCKPGEACAQFLVEVTPNLYKVSVLTGATAQDFGSFTVTAN